MEYIEFLCEDKQWITVQGLYPLFIKHLLSIYYVAVLHQELEYLSVMLSFTEC